MRFGGRRLRPEEDTVTALLKLRSFGAREDVFHYFGPSEAERESRKKCKHYRREAR
jgi:hypothetical protein